MCRQPAWFIGSGETDQKPDIGIGFFFSGERRGSVQLNGDRSQKFETFGITVVRAMRFVDSKIGQSGELAHESRVVPTPGIQQSTGTLFVDVNEILHGVFLQTAHRTDWSRSGGKDGLVG